MIKSLLLEWSLHWQFRRLTQERRLDEGRLIKDYKVNDKKKKV